MNKTEEILQARVSMLYNSSYFGLFITCVAACGLVMGVEHENFLISRYVWLALVVVVVVIRLIDFLLWRKNPNYLNISTATRLIVFRVSALFSAVLWSIYCLYFFSYSTFNQIYLNVVVIAGLAGGAATLLSADRLLATVFTQLLLVPFSILLMTSESIDMRLLGYLGICYAIVMFSSVKRSSEFFTNSMELRFEHNDLLQTLQQKVEKRTLKIIELSNSDALTKLLNRAAFIEFSKNLVMETANKQFAILFLDLNGFKPINDNFGHDVGDKVLIEMAMRMIEHAGNCNHVCRWGGDEFLILYECSDDVSLDLFISNLKSLIRRPARIDNYLVELDVAVGVALYPDHSQDLSELIKFADFSMFKNKKNKDTEYVIFDNLLGSRVRREYELNAAIKVAVEKQQLNLVYQPIYWIDRDNSKKMYAVEALLRWCYQGTAISPEIFIAIAEKNGAIREIGYWVLEESISHLKMLQNKGAQIKCCVNVSVMQFDDPKLVDFTQEMLIKYDVSPSSLHIEITETVFSGNHPKIKMAIRQFQALGVLVSIDDFGTGYSSLAVIQDLNVNFVKIDRSFVMNIVENGCAVIKAIMMMAKELNYQVVAEGVEEGVQKEKLVSLGVLYFQGYLFNRPMAFERLIELLNDPSESEQLCNNKSVRKR